MIPIVLTLIEGESRLFAMDFGSLLADGETISTIVSVTSSCNDLDISGEYIQDNRVYFRLANGSACHRCWITVTITTSDSNTLIDTGQLKIAEE